MGVFEFNRIMFTLCLSEKKRILKREANISQIVWIGLDEGLSHSGRWQEGRLWRNNYMN